MELEETLLPATGTAGTESEGTESEEKSSVAARRALKALVPSAIETLRDLLPNAKDDVRLRAATAILDRAGVGDESFASSLSIPPETLISALTGMASAMGGSLTAALEKALSREPEPRTVSEFPPKKKKVPTLDKTLLARLNDAT